MVSLLNYDFLCYIAIDIFLIIEVQLEKPKDKELVMHN